MQLGASRRPSALRTRLGAAACLLVAAGTRSAAADTVPKWQFDGAGLLYGEKGRAKVFEPQARITRIFPDGQTLSATLGLDVITGASPTGAVPSGAIQTTTTPSGNTMSQVAGAIPVHPFSDTREGLDLEWVKPIGGWLTPALGTHFSTEKDYRSLGATAKLSIATMRRLTTFTFGAGLNDDQVDPRGGTKVPLSDGSVIAGTDPNAKRIRSGMAGVSRVLTRRWLVGVNASRSFERGYLTDPYKVISVLDSTDGSPVGELTERRPSTRDRSDVLASSVYHLARDVVYASYRYYWDDWGVSSHTVDARYRLELANQAFLQPHIRYYFQTRANFFQFGLPQNAPLPAYATSDPRLGDLRTLTLGGTYGFHVAGTPGEFSIRPEYIRQWGRSSGGHGQEVDGGSAAATGIDFSPPVDIGSLVVSYSVPF